MWHILCLILIILISASDFHILLEVKDNGKLQSCLRNPCFWIWKLESHVLSRDFKRIWTPETFLILDLLWVEVSADSLAPKVFSLLIVAYIIKCKIPTTKHCRCDAVWCHTDYVTQELLTEAQIHWLTLRLFNCLRSVNQNGQKNR